MVRRYQQGGHVSGDDNRSAWSRVLRKAAKLCSLTSCSSGQDAFPTVQPDWRPGVRAQSSAGVRPQTSAGVRPQSSAGTPAQPYGGLRPQGSWRAAPTPPPVAWPQYLASSSGTAPQPPPPVSQPYTPGTYGYASVPAAPPQDSSPWSSGPSYSGFTGGNTLFHCDQIQVSLIVN